jgi:hypothetical protein
MPELYFESSPSHVVQSAASLEGQQLEPRQRCNLRGEQWYRPVLWSLAASLEKGAVSHRARVDLVVKKRNGRRHQDWLTRKGAPHLATWLRRQASRQIASSRHPGFALYIVGMDSPQSDDMSPGPGNVVTSRWRSNGRSTS